MDRFASITAFVRVAESGGFSGAGRRLNLSKATVSDQVQALENTLGVRLLNRIGIVARPRRSAQRCCTARTRRTRRCLHRGGDLRGLPTQPGLQQRQPGRFRLFPGDAEKWPTLVRTRITATMESSHVPMLSQP